MVIAAWCIDSVTHELQTLFEDEHWWVVNKPAGMLTTSPKDRPKDRALADIARDARLKAKKMHATSRLDRGVSGALTLAKSAWAISAALEARATKQYKRRYLGLARPRPEHSWVQGQQGRWEEAIGIAPRDRTLRIIDTGDPRIKGVREAATRFEVLSLRDDVLVLALYPETGRTHQLRVHAAHAGLPLWGDRPYGGAVRHTFSDGRVHALHRPMLHCQSVRICTTKGTVEAEAPVPDEMLSFWQALGGTLNELAP